MTCKHFVDDDCYYCRIESAFNSPNNKSSPAVEEARPEILRSFIAYVQHSKEGGFIIPPERYWDFEAGYLCLLARIMVEKGAE